MARPSHILTMRWKNKQSCAFGEFRSLLPSPPGFALDADCFADMDVHVAIRNTAEYEQTAFFSPVSPATIRTAAYLASALYCIILKLHMWHVCEIMCVYVHFSV